MLLLLGSYNPQLSIIKVSHLLLIFSFPLNVMSILSWLVMCPVRLSCLCDKIWGKQFNEGKLHHAPSGRGFIHPGWGGYSPVSCLVVEAERAGSKERDLGSNAAHWGSLSHLLCSDRWHLGKVPVLLLLQECHQLKSKTLIPKPL